MEKILTIIIPTYNNPKELTATLESILELIDFFDLLIIDSSDNYPLDFKFKNELGKFSKWVKPNGVYDAINRGIELTNTRYLMTLNSGDTVISSSLIKILENYLNVLCTSDLLVGCQNVSYRGIIYKYSPSFNSLWPHQSVIYKKELHDKIGLFNTNYKIISDQLFFEKIKIEERLNIKFIEEAITTYDVTGMSSIMNSRNLNEYKVLNTIRRKTNLKLYLRYGFYQLCKFLNIDFNIVWHSIKMILIPKSNR